MGLLKCQCDHMNLFDVFKSIIISGNVTGTQIFILWLVREHTKVGS